MIKFARLFERGQRQILARIEGGGEAVYNEHGITTVLILETPSVGYETVTVTMGFRTVPQAVAALEELDEDSVFASMTAVIDQMYDDGQ